MTVKQKLYLEGVISGKTKKQSALDAGYSESTALTASQNIESDIFRDELSEAMNEAGLDTLSLISKLKQGLEAVEVNPPSFRDEDFPDYNLRLKYLMLALRLKKLI